MLSILNKLFEKVIQRRLIAFGDENNVLNKEQFGFRKEHSTVHQIKRVMNIIELNKANRKRNGVDCLIFKLNKFGFPLTYKKTFKIF